MKHSLSRRLLAASLLGLALPAIAGAQPADSSVAPTITNPNRYAVTGVPAARRFFQLAAARRVDICIIGDSNTRVNSFGHETGMALAFGARFGVYATGIEPGAGVGWWAATINSTAAYQFPPFANDAPPLSANLVAFTDPGLNASFAGLQAGVACPSDYNSGLTLSPDHPMDITGPLRYHATQWAFGPGTGGYLNPVCREVWAPYSTYASAPTISTAGTQEGLQDFSFDIPAGARSPYGAVFCFTDIVHNRDARGPICVTWQRVENTSRSSGIAYSALYGQGGQSAYSACNALLPAAAPTREWMRQAAMLQNGPPVLLVQILHGGNDVLFGQLSLGPIGGIVSALPAGQKDNTLGIINSLRHAWVLNGYDPQNLFFLLGPYHPLPYANVPMPQYEQGWRDISAADPQVFTIAGTMLSTPAELASSGDLSNGYDPSHLSVAGGTAWGRATVTALDRALCAADFNENGSLSAGDIFDYLNAWFDLDPRADFNYSGAIDVSDLYDYLNAWFAGC